MGPSEKYYSIRMKSWKTLEMNLVKDLTNKVFCIQSKLL